MKKEREDGKQESAKERERESIIKHISSLVHSYDMDDKETHLLRSIDQWRTIFAPVPVRHDDDILRFLLRLALVVVVTSVIVVVEVCSIIVDRLGL